MKDSSNKHTRLTCLLGKKRSCDSGETAEGGRDQEGRGVVNESGPGRGSLVRTRAGDLGTHSH